MTLSTASFFRRSALPFCATLMTLWQLATPASAQDSRSQLTITTGSPSGTYYTFARNMQETVQRQLDIRIVESDGSIQNLQRLLGYEGVNEGNFYQLALVQADVLDRLRERAAADPVLSSIVDRVKVVLPLYGEEVHAYTNLDIRSVTELVEGNYGIGSGNKTSGTFMTASWIYEHFGGQDQTHDFYELSGSNGLAELDLSINVLFQVAGVPSDLGRSIDSGSGINLIPIEAPSLVDQPNSPYSEAVISRDVYPWLERDIKTISVKALLVAFNYGSENPHCESISTLTRSVLQNLDVLKETGHRKWREVDLVGAANRPDIHDCASDVLIEFAQ